MRQGLMCLISLAFASGLVLPDRAAAGRMYFDDIRLYRQAPVNK